MPASIDRNSPLQPHQVAAARFDAAKAKDVVRRLEEALNAAADAGIPHTLFQIEMALDVVEAEMMRGGRNPEG